MKKVAITFSILLYAFAVPYLEINETHVFNPNWTPHARIHEVWQLITNTSIGFLCLWLIWKKKETSISGVLSLMVTGGFLMAYFLKNIYGGSMKYMDGSEKTLLSMNIGLLGFGLAFAFIVLAYLLERKN